MNKCELKELQQKVLRLRAEGNYKETINNCYKLLKFGEILYDYKSILISYVNLAASYYSIGEIEMAFDAIMKHKEISASKGDEFDMLHSHNVLFIIYEYNKNIEKAKEILLKSIKLGKKLSKYNIVSNSYSNYSHVCMLEEDYKQALHMGNLGLKMAKLHEPKSRILEIRVKLNIAKAYIGLKDFKSAKILIDDIINDEILDSFIREKAHSYDLLGHWFSKQNLNAEAFEEFTKAKELAETFGDINLLKEIQEERCKLCDIMGEINSGYIVQKEYIELLGEISKMELDQIALKHEIRLEFKEMEKKANVDFLTGAYNRRYMEETVDKLLKESIEKRESIVCILLDIDNFKMINDKYGHVFGDNAIKAVSEACKYVLGHYDILGRYGGDEFLVISEKTTFDRAINMAKEILNNIRKIKLIIDNEVVPITSSLGVTSSLSSGATDFIQLLHSADLKLYEAKKLGRNRVFY